jgi:hypothetical protein
MATTRKTPARKVIKGQGGNRVVTDGAGKKLTYHDGKSGKTWDYRTNTFVSMPGGKSPGQRTTMPGGKRPPSMPRKPSPRKGTR